MILSSWDSTFLSSWDSTVSASRVTFRDKRLAVCSCPCMRSMQSVWEIFICLSWLDFPGNHKHLFWMQRMTCSQFAYSVYKPAKFTRVQSLLLLRWFQTTPMNAITCSEMLSSIPNEQQASDLRKPSREIQKSVLDFVAHGDSKTEVKVDLTFHWTPGKQKNKQFGRWGLKNQAIVLRYFRQFKSRKNNGQAHFSSKSLQSLKSRQCARPADVAESGPQA